MGNCLFKYQIWSVNLSRWQTVWPRCPVNDKSQSCHQWDQMDPVQRGSWWTLAVSPSLTVLHCPGSRMGFVQHVPLVLCGVKVRRNGFKPTWILYCIKCLTWIGSVRVIGVVCYLSQTCFAMGLLQSRWDYQASLPDTDEFWSPAQVVDDVG